ncbi:hypothetical protein DRN98_01575 [Methanosarcinales archaeon]|nr:MAG: hypothetical protein DRN98_01575 [Methanosarcinales archaeon]
MGRGVLRRLEIERKFPVEVFEDPRAKEIKFLRCIQCGRCTGGCPAAYVFDDFSPRKVILKLLEGEIDDLLRKDLIWHCGQCYTCHMRCPRGNSPATAVLILRELALERGYSIGKVKEIADQCGRLMWAKGVNFYGEGSRELSDEAICEVQEVLKQSGYKSFLEMLGVDLP